MECFRSVPGNTVPGSRYEGGARPCAPMELSDVAQYCSDKLYFLPPLPLLALPISVLTEQYWDVTGTLFFGNYLMVRE